MVGPVEKRTMKVVTMAIMIQKQQIIESKKNTHAQATKEILDREKIQTIIK